MRPDCFHTGLPRARFGAVTAPRSKPLRTLSEPRIPAYWLLTTRANRMQPEGANHDRASLAALQRTPSLLAARNAPRTEVGQRVLLAVSPNRFRGVEFRRISRQTCRCDLSPGCSSIGVDPPAALHRQAVQSIRSVPGRR